MTKALLLLLAVLVLSAHSLTLSDEKQTPLIGQVENPSGVLAATWFGGFCHQHGKCDKEHLRKWDNESFTIHGLWPNLIGNETYGDFNYSFIRSNTALFNNLSNYWPPQSKSIKHQRNRDPNKSTYFLWNHEYTKHGQIYANILQSKKPSEYQNATDQVLQQAFFQAGLDFYLKNQLTKLNLSLASPPVELDKENLYVTKSQLSQIIDLKEDLFLVQCLQDDEGNSNILQEIHICFRFKPDLTIDHQVCEQIVRIDGSSHPMNDTCDDGLIRMKGYQEPQDGISQPQVTLFDPITDDDIDA